jgi:hypothetical protein
VHNLNDGEGRHANGVGVAHPPERERRGGAEGGVEEGALREEVGGGGRKRDAEEGEGGLGGVPHEGEGEVGDRAEEALQGLRRGGVQPPHVRLRPRDRQLRRRLPHVEGLNEGGEVVGARVDGGEVVGEEAGIGEGVEERLEDEVEEDGAEGAALRHAAQGQDDLAVRKEDGAAEEVEEGADERVAAEEVKDGLDGAVQERIEGGDEVDEGHPRAAGEGFAQPQRRPKLVASGRVECELPAGQRGLAVHEEAVDECAHDEAIVRRRDGEMTEGAVALGGENRLAQRPACAAGAARARLATVASVEGGMSRL